MGPPDVLLVAPDWPEPGTAKNPLDWDAGNETIPILDHGRRGRAACFGSSQPKPVPAGTFRLWHDIRSSDPPTTYDPNWDLNWESAMAHNIAANSPIKRPSKSTDSVDDRLLFRVQQMTEYELTLDVLKPLFLQLGYTRVEYHGGPNEHGADLVCWGKDRFGNPEILVTQVKKYKPSAKAASDRSFSEIVTQLSQAIETPLPTLESGRLLPTEVCFVTPFPIEIRVLQTRFDGFQALKQRRVRLIDGTQLANLVRLHLPRLYAQLTGTCVDLMARTTGHMDNSPLMNALGAGRGRDIRSFFTDIDFAVGRRSSRLYLTSQFSAGTEVVALDPQGWGDLRATEDFCRNVLQVQMINVPLKDIDGILDCARREYEENLSRRSELVHSIRDLWKKLQSQFHIVRGTFTLLGLSHEKYLGQRDRLTAAISAFVRGV